MNLGQNVFLDHLWVRFSKCYDTQVSVTGPSWLSCVTRVITHSGQYIVKGCFLLNYAEKIIESNILSTIKLKFRLHVAVWEPQHININRLFSKLLPHVQVHCIYYCIKRVLNVFVLYRSTLWCYQL